MQRENQSVVNGLILLGFSIPSQIKIVLFLVFLIIYLITLVANGFIIRIVQANSQLHSPMYFFICNLSFLDLCFLTTNIPTCLKGLLCKWSTISYSGCVAQMLIGLSLGSSECILLADMAWDRYIAICNPLNYPRIMNKVIYVRLAIATWASGFMLSMVQMHFLMSIPFCGHYKINHVVCKLAAFLRLACVDLHMFELVMFVISLVFLVAPLSLIIFTYLCIITTILRMPTASGRQKAFSTCSSHLMVVILFYGTTMVMYMRPRSMTSAQTDKVISVFYGLVTPALNPLIYTLRNKNVKGALKKMIRRNMPQTIM